MTDETIVASTEIPSGDTNTEGISKQQPAVKDEGVVQAFWKKHSRSGGAYIPPRRAAMMEQSLPEEGTEAYQRLSWEALRKSLNGLINKVNTANIKEIIVELFGENLIRGRGLLVRAVMRAQSAALPFTAVYAAMMAVINTKLPQIGELLVTRLVHQFRRAYRRNDKLQCLAVCTFIAHLVNQRLAHEILALQLLTLLLERPTDDSVEIAVGFMRECGSALQATSPRPTAAVFERFRVILHEGRVDKRVQYMVEVLFQLRKDGFVGHEALATELDLVPEEDQITHYVGLDDELNPEEGLNIFHVDPEFTENEEKYNDIRAEILEGSEDEAEAEEEPVIVEQTTTTTIKDETKTDLLNLRKTIYLTVMSSVDFEECGHKLLKLKIPEGLEPELCSMIIECCAQERTYLRFFGLLAERFCLLDEVWRAGFEEAFNSTYATVHRLETGKIRNVARLFAHLLFTDAVPWGALLAGIRLSEDCTTSASRILIKFLFQELSELYGIPALRTKLSSLPPIAIAGLFPRDDLRDCRFSINFFTAIGLGGITEDLRAFLAEATEHQMQIEAERTPLESRDYKGEGGMNPERMAMLGIQPHSDSEDSYASSSDDERERERGRGREDRRDDHRDRSRDSRRDYHRDERRGDRGYERRDDRDRHRDRHHNDHRRSRRSRSP